METEARTPEETASVLLPSNGLSIRLFGEFEMLRQSVTLPRTRSRTETWLLAFLILQGNRSIERSYLAGTFWPESGEAQALNNLRRSLSNLRQVLGEESYRLIAPTSHTISFDLTNAFCDVTAFDDALSRKDTASLGQAATLYRGPLLPDCDMAWILPERSAREQAFLTVLETLAGQAVREGNAGEGIRLLRQSLSVEPLRETTHRALMEALSSTGDWAGMMQAYRQLRLLLHDELRAAPSAETQALYRRLQQNFQERAAEPGSASERTEPPLPRIPWPVSELIGRDAEIAEIASLLGTHRLVTLTGSGGVGKTRLALSIAAQVAPAFPDGVWFIDLSHLTDPTQVVAAVAHTLDVRERQEGKVALLDTLREHLHGKRLLLILDNCEHLVESCAALVGTLLEALPSLHLLSTSRMKLGIDGEQVWRVPSLPFPDPASAPPLKTLLTFSGPRLFVTRAQSATSSFYLTERNAPAVLQICARLEGIPLALELAAARTASLSVEQIAARLEDAFRLLMTGTRNALPRHQTLQALVDWSYDLLSKPEKALLARLSVFAGGWSLEAAEAVVSDMDKGGRTRDENGSVLPLPEILDLLTSLVDRSLVLAEVIDGAMRYRMLETLRQYSARKRNAQGESIALQRRHRDYFLHLAEETRPHLTGAEQMYWLSILEREHDNLRQSLQFCQEDPTGGEAGLQLAGVMAVFWDLRGYLSEGRKLLHTALSHSGAQEPNSIRANALLRAGVLAWDQGDYDASRSLFEQALTIYRQQGDVEGLARTLGSLGDLERDQGDYSSARTHYTEELQFYRELQAPHGIGSSLLSLAILTLMQGDLDTARSLFEESLTLQREFGDRQSVALALNGLGNLNRQQGDFDTARMQYEESLALRRELGSKSGVAATLNSLGNLAMNQKDYQSARTLYAESLTLQREMSNRSGIAYALESLGRAVYAEGDVISGRSLCREALTHFRELGDTSGIAGTLHTLGTQALEEEDDRSARTLLAECLRRFVMLEDKKSVAAVLDAFITLSAREGQGARAIRLWAAWNALHEAHDIFLPDQDRLKHEVELSPIRQVLGEKVCAELGESGRAMTWEQAAVYALEDE